jgi:hypothetical protein
MKIRTASMALMAGLTLAAPTAAFAAPQASIVETVKTDKAAPTQSADYAQREAQDQKVANYEGGAGSVVVVMSGGALVVLLLLLLLL